MTGPIADEPTRAGGWDHDRDDRIAAAAHAYSQALERGEHPQRHAFTAANPDIASELSACLRNIAFLHHAAGEMRGEREMVGTLGDFKLVRRLGQGGMGVVYEAIQLSLNRPVAVKILPRVGGLDARQLERFKQEAHAAARLQHANIVPVYAVGSEDGVHYYAMQLIQGESLAQVLAALVAARDGTMAAMPATLPHVWKRKRTAYLRRVAELIADVARALHYAHQVGVVHRDIKPANLLLDSAGKIWIADFGLAQLTAEVDPADPGDCAGTLRYMSPEQAAGQSVLLDQRTDVYSLGAALYELLTLRKAVDATDRDEILAQIFAAQPRSMRSLDRAIPRELQTIVGKAMARDPADRYQTAQALADDLQRYLRTETILARPPAFWERAFKWSLRHKQVTASAMAALTVSTMALAASNIHVAREQARTQEAYALASAEARAARRAQAQAEKNFADARKAVDFMTHIAVEEMPRNPSQSAIRLRLLETAAEFYGKFQESQPPETAAAQHLSEAQENVKRMLWMFQSAEQRRLVDFQWWLLQQSAVQQDLQLNQAQVSKVTAPAGGLSAGYGRGGRGRAAPDNGTDS
ncbi:MAG TPA: serine/threonine-protein kinase, partial [Phycisphaerae bacterium]|nr:serine/threonine-protein kinase [Phycisphaerae bacterium]